jgi:predicted AlkP superfamily phosphohydrolase/phosphomutase
VEESWRVINWPKTKVYGSLGGDSMILIRLNLKGREPNGAVSPGPEEEELKSHIKERLLSLAHPSTGELLVDKVYEANEVYTGPCMNFAPDLIGVFKNYEYIATGKVFTKNWLEETYSGQHRMEGILVMKGEDIQKGKNIPDCEIIDLAPTILHLMGMAVPLDMDGKVLEEAFHPSFLGEKPVRFREPPEQDLERKILDVGLNKEGKQEVIDLLKGLGYID